MITEKEPPIKITKVKVTNKDIIDGTPHSCFDCPVAYALLRELKYSYRYISVARTIRFSGWDYDIGIKLQQWIRNYDDGLNVKPITLEVKQYKMPIAGTIEII